MVWRACCAGPAANDAGLDDADGELRVPMPATAIPGLYYEQAHDESRSAYVPLGAIAQDPAGLAGFDRLFYVRHPRWSVYEYGAQQLGAFRNALGAAVAIVALRHAQAWAARGFGASLSVPLAAWAAGWAALWKPDWRFAHGPSVRAVLRRRPWQFFFSGRGDAGGRGCHPLVQGPVKIVQNNFFRSNTHCFAALYQL